MNMVEEPHLADSPSLTLDQDAFDAVIFDLDGVVTQTAAVHAITWKATFDPLLQGRAVTSGTDFLPFDADTDYRRYVDGKPRHDGVVDFLSSRGIELPYGDPSDPPEYESVCGLGNRKNRLYLEKLKQGVKVYASTIALIRQLRAQGIKTAIISASRNCEEVLEAAGIADLFDARVDGVELDLLGLEGKPEPDVFLEAARRLEVEPARAVVVEDALAGVQAGRRGGFGLVIGVNRGEHGAELADNGAQAVVADLAEVGVGHGFAPERHNSDELPSALAALAKIKAGLQGRGLAVFLDYDGTLTPIVQRPELALLSTPMREAIRTLARRCTVAVVSGRDLPDVQARVGLEEIVYAGSHGFEISGPRDLHIQQQHGTKFLPQLDLAEQALHERLDQITGLLVERKKFSIAIHFRQVDAADLSAVEPVVDAVLAAYPQLRKTRGKKIYELQPDIDWDKGRAIIWLLDTLDLPGPEVLALYLGDDLTDEDAFKALQGRGNGLGILVRDESRATAAHYALEDQEQVRRFLEALSALIDGGKK